MTTPKSGDTVTIDYVLRRGDGQIVGDTSQAGPQQITLGSGQIFPQIEEALIAMQVGDQQTVAIPSDNAFGPRHPELIVEIPRSNLPPEPAPQPGMSLQAQQSDGTPVNLTIVAVNEDSVTADGNHPLAGEDVTFEVTLREIAQAA